MLSSDSVHIHDALLGERLAHSDGGTFLRLVLSLANEASLLKLLKAVADVFAAGEAGVLHGSMTRVFSSEVLTESLDTDLLSHVKLVANSSSAGEKPVVVVRAELLVASGLNCLGPLLNIILIRID